MRVLTVWRMGGPATREAVAAALVGTDADVKAFLDNGWNRAAESDERSRVVEMLESSGVSVKQAAQRALDAGNPSSVKEFLQTGYVAPNTQDLRIRINQMMAVGGANLRAAGQAALDVGTVEAYRAFLDNGWQTPDTADQRIRVNQLMAAGGQKVKQKAQEALDRGTSEAYQQFFDYEWPTAQARDQETASIVESWAWRNAVSHAAEESAKIAETQRLANLGYDFAKSKFIEDEYKVAVLLEQKFRLQLMRFPEVKGQKNPDWIDANGLTYDAVGPIPTQFFDKQWQLGKIQAQIKTHLDKADMVPFDIRGLTPDQVKLVEAELNKYDTLRVFIIQTR